MFWCFDGDVHLFPFRTEKLSSLVPMIVLLAKVGRRQNNVFKEKASKKLLAFLLYLWCFCVISRIERRFLVMTPKQKLFWKLGFTITLIVTAYKVIELSTLLQKFTVAP